MPKGDAAASGWTGKLVGLAVLAVVVFLFLSRCEQKRHQTNPFAARECIDARSRYWEQRSLDGALSDEQIHQIIEQCMTETQRQGARGKRAADIPAESNALTIDEHSPEANDAWDGLRAAYNSN